MKKLVIWESAKPFCEIRKFCVIVVAVWFVGLQFKQKSSSQELAGQSGVGRDAERESKFHRNYLHRSQLSFFPVACCAVSILKLWFSRTVYIKKNTAESVQKQLFLPGIVLEKLLMKTCGYLFVIFVIHAHWFPLPLSYFPSISRWTPTFSPSFSSLYLKFCTRLNSL